uniref:Organ specific protein n=1 Tax=Rhabditophanes sp. KR3021 TaxID=114890 RepID=A0AC35U8H2_9BILA
MKFAIFMTVATIVFIFYLHQTQAFPTIYPKDLPSSDWTQIEVLEPHKKFSSQEVWEGSQGLSYISKSPMPKEFKETGSVKVDFKPITSPVENKEAPSVWTFANKETRQNARLIAEESEDPFAISS